jgi:eukaryotic-like serine/threonine-protein kinase
MRHKGDLPAFSHHVIEINKKLSSLHSINFSSSGDLANVILKDVSLTNKLLRIVNSSFYGNLSGKVTTISRAVFLLGAEKVRMAAASVMVMDHLQNKSQAAELKDAALISFLSSIMAKNIAEKMMFHAAEEVFICALLHNLGKHLVICYFPEEYAEIKKNIAETGNDEQSISKMVLGVSYSELGQGISRSWGFPENIINSMDVITDKETKASENEADVFKSIANYANELCVIASDADGTTKEEALRTVFEKYQLTVSFPVNRTMNLIEDAVSKIDQFAEAFKIDKSKSPLFRSLSSYGQEKSDAGEPSSGSNIPNPYLNEFAVPHARPTKPLSHEKEKLEMLKSCLAEINDMLDTQCSISAAIYMIMETMYRGFEFNRVLLCMVDQSHTKMAARFGFGENIDMLLRNFEFKITRSSDFFNIAVMRMKDFVVDDSQAAGVRGNLPDWYLNIISAQSFLIYPLLIKEKCIGLFYADKKKTGILTNDQLDYMNILRDKAIWAILHKR